MINANEPANINILTNINNIAYLRLPCEYLFAQRIPHKYDRSISIIDWHATKTYDTYLLN